MYVHSGKVRIFLAYSAIWLLLRGGIFELKTPYDTYIPTNEMGNNIIKTVTENVQLKIIGTGYKKF